MKLFLSWSGDLSKKVAASLRKHLPWMIQSLDVFMSKHDIESGTRWADELSQELEQTTFGILCLTKESLSSQWLLFEAGALVKHSAGRACGLLLGTLGPAEITGPLAQFQHRTFEHDEFLHLLKDINNRLETPLPSDSLTAVLSKWWPDIQREYEAALAGSVTKPQSPNVSVERHVLDELVLRLRALEIRSNSSTLSPDAAGGDVLARPITYDSLAWYTLWKFPGRPISEKIQTLLLRDLDYRKYPTIEDLNKVVDLARPAVEKYTEQNPDWFQFGTDYITKSLGFIDRDFRARHGFATRTLRAFEALQGMVQK
jgi:hypothetical protein